MGFRDVMLDKKTQRANAIRRKKIGDFIGEKLREIRSEQKKMKVKSAERRRAGAGFAGRNNWFDKPKNTNNGY